MITKALELRLLNQNINKERTVNWVVSFFFFVVVVWVGVIGLIGLIGVGL